MTERKLATIQRVKALFPIPGADVIEACQINGWMVVVKKGEYNVGDLVIYCEIDSWIPNKIAPFLTKDGYPPKEFNGVQGERLKTIKLRKQISQGLILPISGFDAYYPGAGSDLFNEGDDVTSFIGIQKWEMPEKEIPGRQVGAQGTKRFPAFIPKTDQERIQNYGEMVLQALDEEFEATMKKDGSSMTVFCVNPDSEYYESAKALYKSKMNIFQRFIHWAADIFNGPESVYGICSRNVLLNQEGDSNFHKAAKDVLSAMRDNKSKISYAIQGEVVAPDIQDNYEKVKRIEFHVYDVFNIDSQKYCDQFSRKAVVQDLNLNHVTTLATNSLRIMLDLPAENVTADDVVKAALTYASGKGDNPGVMREGVVFKNTQRDFSFKSISNEYLLKKG